MNHLRRIAPELDLEVEWFRRLDPLAEALDLPSDWRQKQLEAKDMGLRPKLDDLGPFRWQPSPAPNWKLTDRNAVRLSLYPRAILAGAGDVPLAQSVTADETATFADVELEWEIAVVGELVQRPVVCVGDFPVRGRHLFIILEKPKKPGG